MSYRGSPRATPSVALGDAVGRPGRRASFFTSRCAGAGRLGRRRGRCRSPRATPWALPRSSPRAFPLPGSDAPTSTVGRETRKRRATSGPAGLHLPNQLPPGDRRQTRVGRPGACNTHSSRRGPSPATTYATPRATTRALSVAQGDAVGAVALVSGGLRRFGRPGGCGVASGGRAAILPRWRCCRSGWRSVSGRSPTCNDASMRAAGPRSRSRAAGRRGPTTPSCGTSFATEGTSSIGSR